MIDKQIIDNQASIYVLLIYYMGYIPERVVVMPSFQFKSSKGFGIIEIIVAVVVIAMLAGGVYLYLQNQSDNGSGSSTQEQKALQAACKVEIDDDLLCKVFSNWGSEIDSEPYTLTTTTQGGSGEEVNMVYKSNGDNHHSINTFGGQTTESITIGQDSYIKMDGQWYKQEPMEDMDYDMDMDMDDSDSSLDATDYFGEDQAGKTEYNRLGTEACGDSTCIKYEIYTTDTPNDKMNVWVDEKNARVMRFQSVDEDGSVYDMVYEYGPVEITAPADAKDMSELMMGF